MIVVIVLFVHFIYIRKYKCSAMAGSVLSMEMASTAPHSLRSDYGDSDVQVLNMIFFILLYVFILTHKYPINVPYRVFI